MSYHMLSKKEVIRMYKDLHQSYVQQAVSFIKNLEYPLSEDDFSRTHKQLAYAITLANTYNLDPQDVLNELKPYVGDFKTLVQKTEEMRQAAHMYKERLDKVVQSGKEMRKRDHLKFPSVFDTTDRLYFEIDEAFNARGIFEQALSILNNDLPEDIHLSVVLQDGKLMFERNVRGSDKKREYKPVTFFQVRHENLKSILTAFEEMPPHVQEQFVHLIEQTKDFGELAGTGPENIGWYTPFRKEHNLTLKKADLRETIIHFIQEEIKRTGQYRSPVSRFKHTLEVLIERFDNLLNDAKRAKEGEHKAIASTDIKTINRISMSIFPMDIARMATYVSNDLHTCMSADHENFKYVPAHIGCGTILVKGFNSQDPAHTISWMMLRPYMNNKNELMYGERPTRGALAPDFSREVSKILNEVIQPNPSDGVYYLDPRMHRENKERMEQTKYGTIPHLYHFSSFESWAQTKEVPYTPLGDDGFKIENPNAREYFTTGSYLIYPKKLDVSEFQEIVLTVNDFKNLEELILPKQAVRFSCDGGKNFPQKLDLSGFERFSLSRSDLMDCDVILPQHATMAFLDGVKNLGGYLNFGEYDQVSIENADLSKASSLKLPDTWRGSLKGVIFPHTGLDLSRVTITNIEDADLSRLTSLKLPNDWDGSLKGVKFPKGVTVEDVLKHKGFNTSLKKEAIHTSIARPVVTRDSR